jgi:hypothetical protein
MYIYLTIKCYTIQDMENRGNSIEKALSSQVFGASPSLEVLRATQSPVVMSMAQVSRTRLAGTNVCKTEAKRIPKNRYPFGIKVSNV